MVSSLAILPLFSMSFSNQARPAAKASFFIQLWELLSFFDVFLMDVFPIKGGGGIFYF